VIAAVPEAIVGCLVAEDLGRVLDERRWPIGQGPYKHETDDDGEAGYLERRAVSIIRAGEATKGVQCSGASRGVRRAAGQCS
jgi:hypothetical protein